MKIQSPSGLDLTLNTALEFRHSNCYITRKLILQHFIGGFMHQTKLSAFISFLALVAPNANAAFITSNQREGTQSQSIDQLENYNHELFDAFETLLQSGTIEVDPNTGNLRLNDRFLDHLIEGGFVDNRQFAGSGSMSNGRTGRGN